ncbi:cytochrome P450 [Microdochium trichocladiopsis]|uniref:Cytochrome P450 n=1 Tax=Microdochium trichocladiopsis TaxID=1682393 RepID=A0A9P8XS73_9PEZI|nr:cytochrome P450 [Microdochium trichocladiopsis]KAH7009077.1 cytochrome P450 [Microdochium trichocladiopsis]
MSSTFAATPYAFQESWIRNSLEIAFATYAGYKVMVALYNISPLHPLSRFPGPKLAAAGYFYEAYYDWICGGKYTQQIKRMHEKYGPIVRINPDELHCNDPLFTDEIYAGPGRIRDKWYHQLNTGGAGPVSATAFSTVLHEVHKMKKAPYARFFSRQQIAKLEGEVLDAAQLVTNKMLSIAQSSKEANKSQHGEVFDVKDAFNCYTADVIGQYAFGTSMGFITQEGWTPNFATWYIPLMADHMGEDIATVMRQMNVVIPGYIQAALDDPENRRVFAEVLQNKSLPDSYKDMFHLSGEGFNFLLAGTETTATLSDTSPSTLKWSHLENKPYFWAIVQESLRIMPGVSHRSARIARDEDLHYKNAAGDVVYLVPRGTPIGMSSVINHMDPKLYPDPEAFRPERWLLDDGSPNYKLQKYLLAFSRGSRSCIGEK